MKKVLFVVAIVAVSFGANAQTMFGAKAGANIANLKLSGGGVSLTYDSKFGANAGFFANIPASSNFRVQPEVVFSMEGAKYDFGTGDNATINLTYVNIPVMFQYVTPSGFYAETGPQAGILASAKAKADGESEDIKESFKTLNLSWGLGAGYKLAGGLGFNARYNFGLSNIGENEDDDDDFSIKSNVIQVGLTYNFGSKK